MRRCRRRRGKGKKVKRIWSQMRRKVRRAWWMRNLGKKVRRIW